MKKILLSQAILVLLLLVSACEREEELQWLSVDEISPGGGMRGDTITTKGSFFSEVPSDNLVTIGGVPATVIAASATELQVIVPESAPFKCGELVVSRKGWRQNGYRTFCVNAYPLPVISGLSPTSGPVGTLVTIYGKHLGATQEANKLLFSDGQGGLLLLNKEESPVSPFVPLIYADTDSIQVRVPVRGLSTCGYIQTREIKTFIFP